MKYVDKDGDTWETFSADELRCVRQANGYPAGGVLPRQEVEDEFGPLRPVHGEEPHNAPSPVLPTVEGVMSRASVFQSAHALVTGLPWGEEEKPSVYDVLSVAKWLEGDE